MTDKVPFQVVTPENLAACAFPDIKVLFKSPSEFSLYIELMASRSERTCTQTLIDFCEDRGIGADEIAKLINGSLKAKIEVEMIEAGLLETRNTLE